MTTTVVATTTTKVKRREPLGTIGMAASQAQSRSAGASGRTGAGKRTRLSATQDGLGEITNKGGKRPACESMEYAWEKGRFMGDIFANGI